MHDTYKWQRTVSRMYFKTDSTYEWTYIKNLNKKIKKKRQMTWTDISQDKLNK